MTIYNPETITKDRKQFQVISETRYYFERHNKYYGEADTLGEAERIARKNKDGKMYPVIYEKDNVDFAIDKYDSNYYVIPKEKASYYYFDSDYKEWCKC